MTYDGDESLSDGDDGDEDNDELGGSVLVHDNSAEQWQDDVRHGIESVEQVEIDLEGLAGHALSVRSRAVHEIVLQVLVQGTWVIVGVVVSCEREEYSSNSVDVISVCVRRKFKIALNTNFKLILELTDHDEAREE